MTDAPKIDTQAPDMIHAAGERLLVEIDMLRDIAGTPDASSICDELRQWVRARIDDRLTSAAREAAAAQAMREVIASMFTHPEAKLVADRIRETPLPTDTTALDRLIAERVREAVEAEREACAKVIDDRCETLFGDSLNDNPTEGQMVNCAFLIRARGSKEGQS